MALVRCILGRVLRGSLPLLSPIEILHQKNICRSVQIVLRNLLSGKINIKDLALKMHINCFI
jgi:hypothetical protein